MCRVKTKPCTNTAKNHGTMKVELFNDKREHWQTIPKFPWYEASTLGRVRSKDRIRQTHKNTTEYEVYHKGRIIKQRKQNSGYYLVWLRSENHAKSIAVTVHRLVAQTFIENPCNYEFVNHIDGDKSNNRVENLEWCTRSRNCKHAYEIGINRSKTIRVKCLTSGVEYNSITEAAKATKICATSIRNCINGKIISTKGTRWTKLN